jgi:Protein of unknown function (DUF3619)
MTINTIPTQLPFQDAFARKVVSHLNKAADDLPRDISERLKVARSQALAKRRVIGAVVANEAAVSGNALMLNGGSDRQGLWGWLGSVLPLVALVAGLMAIAVIQDDLRASEIAAVDAELLTDELPPAAYTDPGFLQFLRSNHAER